MIWSKNDVVTIYSYMSSQTELSQTSSEETTLRGRGYKILKKLGEGSFAKVFLAEYKPDNDPDRNSILACKIVDTSKAPKDVVRKFLPRELDILVKLNHPHIVQVHSIFQRRTKYFIFMRFAENGDMLDFVLNKGPVGENQARIWLRQLALALQYLHEMEIAHRDIKCENVLLTINCNAKLADFGFARYVTDINGKRVLSDTFCGSLLYAAPEILRGSPYNPKIADLWSLGVILYIILNKAMPFDDTNLIRLYELQSNRRWKFRRKVVDALGDKVKNVVTNLLEPDTTKRWRVDQVIHSSWVAMDPRLIVLTPTEQAALDNAIDDRKKIEEKYTRKHTIIFRVDEGKNKNNPTTINEEIENVIHIKEASTGDRYMSSALIESQNIIGIETKKNITIKKA